MSKTTTKLEALFAIYAFDPSGEKARLVGPEPTNTVSAASVFVSMIATEFCDGIVAYIYGCVGLITREDEGKLNCAARSPKAAWALFIRMRLPTQSKRPIARYCRKPDLVFSVVVFIGDTNPIR